MGCKVVFWAEVAQGCIGGGIGHKKASRVVKHREAIVWSLLNKKIGLLQCDMFHCNSACHLSGIR
jgi:hypothetical protein